MTQSASAWPSISQYKKSMHMAIPYSTYNHTFTLFAVLLLMTTLDFFSALDSAVHCTAGTQVKLWFQRSDFEWDWNNVYFNNVDFSECRSKYSNIFGEGGSGSSGGGNGNGNITYYSNDGYAYGYSDDGARRHGRDRNLQMRSLEDATENNNNNNANGGYYGNDDANADQDDANVAANDDMKNANDDVHNYYNDDQGNAEGNNQNDDANANAADDNGANAYGYEYAYRNQNDNQNEYYGNQNWNQQQNGNGYYAYYDQNSNRYAKAESCRELFCPSILKSCPIVAFICALACRWTLKDDSQWKKDLRSSALKASLSPTSMSTPTFGPSTAYTYTSAHAVPKSISLAKGYNNRYTMQYDDRDTQRVEDFKSLVDNQCRHLRSCKMLLLLSIACMALWTRVQVLIEAQSDYPTTIYNDDDDGRQQEEEDLFNLQFQSLGAINNVGEVGQNANLYYSGWISHLITIALMHELSRITLKHRRTTKKLQLELAKISKHASSGTQTNAMETIMTKTKSQQQLM